MSRILAASKKIHSEKAEKQQQRLSKEERLAMESWMQMDREYPVGASGNAMTNQRRRFKRLENCERRFQRCDANWRVYEFG